MKKTKTEREFDIGNTNPPVWMKKTFFCKEQNYTVKIRSSYHFHQLIAIDLLNLK